MIRIIIALLLTTSIAFAQLLGFDGINNTGRGAGANANCIQYSVGNCILYNTGNGNPILVQ